MCTHAHDKLLAEVVGVLKHARVAVQEEDLCVCVVVCVLCLWGWVVDGDKHTGGGPQTSVVCVVFGVVGWSMGRTTNDRTHVSSE